MLHLLFKSIAFYHVVLYLTLVFCHLKFKRFCIVYFLTGSFKIVLLDNITFSRKLIETNLYGLI